MSEQTTPRRLPAFAKAMMQFQAFLLRRNWMGAMGDEVMVITVAGRKSGKTYATPIGYLREGNALLALSGNGGSHWYHNVLHHGRASVNVRGRDLRVRAEAVTDPAERQRIFALYQRERAKNFKLLFGVPVDAPAEALAQALATRVFVRFHPLG